VSTARLQRSLRATFLGLAANVVLTLAKFLAGIFGHSQALIADAVESLADIFSSMIVWRGLVVAETPPDEDHPYGHGKAEPIAAAVVSAQAGFTTGGGFASVVSAASAGRSGAAARGGSHRATRADAAACAFVACSSWRPGAAAFCSGADLCSLAIVRASATQGVA